MKALMKVLAGIALAFGISNAANAATLNLNFPTVDPTIHNQLDFGCTYLHPCVDKYQFTLADAVNTSLKVDAFGAFSSYSWALNGASSGLIVGASGGAVLGLATLADIGPMLLLPDIYTFKISFTNGAVAYRLTLADPPLSTPIPGAALLFGSGLFSLGFLGRKRRKAKAAA